MAQSLRALIPFSSMCTKTYHHRNCDLFKKHVKLAKSTIGIPHAICSFARAIYSNSSDGGGCAPTFLSDSKQVLDAVSGAVSWFNFLSGEMFWQVDNQGSFALNDKGKRVRRNLLDIVTDVSSMVRKTLQVIMFCHDKRIVDLGRNASRELPHAICAFSLLSSTTSVISDVRAIHRGVKNKSSLNSVEDLASGNICCLREKKVSGLKVAIINFLADCVDILEAGFRCISMSCFQAGLSVSIVGGVIGILACIFDFLRNIIF